MTDEYEIKRCEYMQETEYNKECPRIERFGIIHCVLFHRSYEKKTKEDCPHYKTSQLEKNVEDKSK